MALFKNWISQKKRQEEPKAISAEKEKMIQGILSLEETSAIEVMVPRVDAIFLNADSSFEEILTIILDHRYSRYPVYKNRVDNVIGVLYSKDLIRYLYSQEREPFQLERYCREPFFVPASKKLDGLLREFKKRHVHMALVLDEYGGVSGLLSLEDIIEQIVGSIQDEFDNETEEIHNLGSGHYMIDARIAIDELNALLHMSLPNDNFDTLGGFLYNLFGRVPALHQEVEYEDALFIAREVDGQKIKSVELIKDRKHEKD
ncbi:hemolysin family protein [Entomospira culicis]|uniref:HlyC/CorC family transporter n=1 Tax=Entomospira culicis TaxID=2719989 RepID=A0A968GFV6_9SPIO|nr:hemolysin family protein [Entomospira culicis]NIZ18831.1 HlyC/CorC family transporter [Entomospira culicis]NIZ69046.1 HlyC/CorC family transporter [Entomospira culicis]WDI37634.1 hemolysin family protein [Entomospira culicis]WDI39262.1 hemolysin family protein [Entomospira culicis]